MKDVATHFLGEDESGGIWSSEEVERHRDLFIILWTGLIYHRAFVVDKSHYELIGEPLLWIKLAMARD